MSTEAKRTATDWPAIHQMEPGLRFCNEDGEWLEKTPGHGEGWWVWVPTNRAYRRGSGLMESVANGLNRIAAIEWLASECWHPKIVDNRWYKGSDPIDPPFEAMIYDPEHPDADEDTGYRIFGGATLDEALRAAVTAALDTKE